jgi:hypothetical protein
VGALEERLTHQTSDPRVDSSAPSRSTPQGPSKSFVVSGQKNTYKYVRTGVQWNIWMAAERRQWLHITPHGSAPLLTDEGQKQTCKGAPFTKLNVLIRSVLTFSAYLTDFDPWKILVHHKNNKTSKFKTSQIQENEALSIIN